MVHKFYCLYGKQIKVYDSRIYLLAQNGSKIIKTYTLTGNRIKSYFFNRRISCFDIVDNIIYACCSYKLMRYCLRGKLKDEWYFDDLNGWEPRCIVVKDDFIYLSYAGGIQQYDMDGILLNHWKYAPQNINTTLLGNFTILD